jgi:hypothetical protein
MVAVVLFCKDFNAHRPNLSEIGSVRGDVSPGRPVRTHHRRSPRLYAVPKQAEVQNTKIKLSRYQTLAEHTLLTRINRYTKELDVPWCVDAGARRDRKYQQVRDPGSWETAKSENRAEAGECLNSLFRGHNGASDPGLDLEVPSPNAASWHICSPHARPRPLPVYTRPSHEHLATYMADCNGFALGMYAEAEAEIVVCEGISVDTTSMICAHHSLEIYARVAVCCVAVVTITKSNGPIV